MNDLEKLTSAFVYTRDIDQLGKFQEPLSKLSDNDLVLIYQEVLDMSILSWGKRCLLSFVAKQTGCPVNVIAQAFGVSRQTVWRESEIWEKILSKKIELLQNQWLFKTYYKRVIDLTHKGVVENPIIELENIADKRQTIWITNQEKKLKGLPPAKDMSVRDYIREKIDKTYICDLCSKEIKRYNQLKVCDSCYKGVIK